MPKMMIPGDYEPIPLRLEQHEFDALYTKLGLKIHEYVRYCIQLALEKPKLVEQYINYHDKSIKDLAKQTLEVD